ncbi:MULTISPECIES: deoxyribose-phosphate aldolase [unclassified Actinomyces]|uniref:Cgl0159 family (beta/alpha)8-fold protein n=1 Tax=unclassified Actinomyces TaxID=2609248 RepID=UPI0020171A3E|nr:MULTISPECIES: deoxyribose-phosphate aldolase [unclassified Actinomyces]MCL3777602.1 deoxyribose-phosphate aldolase [Actinomyces sp. AC-20-1]MCL3789422.1 deoxyribose-phosphate aldolase [Actinomyces sp. 187325]MCL3794408.1 deoxyribose-phosphate aldolase [Actinomyces sp. 217892]
MTATPLTDRIIETRVHDPGRIAEVLAARPRGTVPEGDGKLMIIACDHPARGALAAGSDPMAMASREDTLARCVEALSRPGVNGFLGTADLIEDLALLGALDGKLVYGSMNRGGLAGATFEMNDRMTGYDARGVADSGLDGGKMLLRVNYEDPRTVDTLAACAEAVNELAERRVMAMVEPFISAWSKGRVVNDLSPEAVIASMHIASGLGRTSAYTWLKLPAVADMERVMEASTLPALILGGAVSQDAEAARESWARALDLPTVKGLVIGRSLLFPPDDDVAGAVDQTVGLLS